ncbi:hypothetical protein Q7C36_012242 [Tachysurus vachellii]|uniref:Uncharacterized protein n=1 Tax=Tachysurus vachellii TaxID=175792 RepID=A0AA88SRL1_TACVA|nr:hypothetical protein Q7C36_012242 [Tachysurus vachellii]
MTVDHSESYHRNRRDRQKARGLGEKDRQSRIQHSRTLKQKVEEGKRGRPEHLELISDTEKKLSQILQRETLQVQERGHAVFTAGEKIPFAKWKHLEKYVACKSETDVLCSRKEVKDQTSKTCLSCSDYVCIKVKDCARFFFFFFFPPTNKSSCRFPFMPRPLFFMLADYATSLQPLYTSCLMTFCRTTKTRQRVRSLRGSWVEVVRRQKKKKNKKKNTCFLQTLA